MNRIMTAICVALIMTFFGFNDALAKDDAKKVETVEYALSPAPHCQNCVNKIKGNLRFEKGVKNIEVDLEKKSVRISFSPKATSEEKLKEALKKIGYTATSGSEASQKQASSEDCCK